MVTDKRRPSDRAFRAIADPTRREILGLLRGGPQTVGELARNFRTSRPAISKHLRLLRRARLVDETRVSRQRIYRLNVAPLQAVDLWLNQYRAFWDTSLSSLKSVVERESARPRRRRS